MDPQQVKSITWILALACGGLAVVAAIVSLTSQKADRRSALTALLGAILISAAAAIFATTLPHGNGAPGAAAALALAVLLAPLAALLTTPRLDSDDYSANLLPGVFLLGASLCAMGIITHHYGIRATTQWYTYSLGLGLGLAWTHASGQTLGTWAEIRMREITGPALCALAVVWATLMASFHFPWPSTAPWFAFFCGVGILGGWTLSLVAITLLPKKHPAVGAALACAFILALAVGLASFSAQKNLLVAHENLLASVAAGFLASLLLLLAATVSGDTEKTEYDPLAGVFVVMLVGGVAWVGFKLWLGLGIVVCALGFLAGYPAAHAVGTHLAARASALAGAFLLLLSGMKIFQQAADLSLNGIDVSEGNVTMALIAGSVFPVIVESVAGQASSMAESIGRYAAGLVVAMGGVLAAALYFGVDGVATALLGIALWSLLVAVSVTASGTETGLLTFRALPYAIMIIALCLLLLPYREHLVEVSRAQKQFILTAIGIIAAVLISVIGSVRKKDRGATENPSA